MRSTLHTSAVAKKSLCDEAGLTLYYLLGQQAKCCVDVQGRGHGRRLTAVGHTEDLCPVHVGCFWLTVTFFIQSCSVSIRAAVFFYRSHNENLSSVHKLHSVDSRPIYHRLIFERNEVLEVL
ncbi:unnamed protein product [Candidula unifasciata]|uniref:Uncharacterized protein n=1 Tax=Candidula unifasciata TaxID=100452 RepID=A0A8S3YJJ7_9EUPU|nr:unnamed protein product [Candidula unifasciata]